MDRVEFQCRTMPEYYEAMEVYQRAVTTNPNAPVPLPPDDGMVRDAMGQFDRMFKSL